MHLKFYGFNLSKIPEKDMVQKPVLYLLPVPISESENSDWIGNSYKEILQETNLLFVENIRTARRFISSLKLGVTINNLHFEELTKYSTAIEIQSFSKQIIVQGKAIIMSESGCPGIADPGALLVNEAQNAGIEIKPMVGPSAILLALMGSGLSGQCFSFNGYLPIDSKDREIRIKQLERESKEKNQTQIFIETPYRNSVIWEALLQYLKPETRLAFAFDLLGKEQSIRQLTIKQWNAIPKPAWQKSPCVFLFQA